MYSQIVIHSFPQTTKTLRFSTYHVLRNMCASILAMFGNIENTKYSGFLLENAILPMFSHLDRSYNHGSGLIATAKYE